MEKSKLISNKADKGNKGNKADKSSKSDKSSKPHYLGHRKRLRDRFLKDDGRSMSDDELLELILQFSLPRADTKPIAKDIMGQCGSLTRLMNAQTSSMLSYRGVGETTAILLTLTRLLAERSHYREMESQHVLRNWSSVLRYCSNYLHSHELERCHLILLDSKKRIIRVDRVAEGSLTQALIHPREIVKIALSVGAASVILVHNHPSGVARPSDEDITLTLEIARACEGLVELFDHIILGEGEKCYSFRSEGLIRGTPKGMRNL